MQPFIPEPRSNAEAEHEANVEARRGTVRGPYSRLHHCTVCRRSTLQAREEVYYKQGENPQSLSYSCQECCSIQICVDTVSALRKHGSLEFLCWAVSRGFAVSPEDVDRVRRREVCEVRVPGDTHPADCYCAESKGEAGLGSVAELQPEVGAEVKLPLSAARIYADQQVTI